MSFFLLAAAVLAVAQDPHAHQPTTPAAPGRELLDIAKRPLPLRTGIGSAHDPVATSSRQAQAFYDQGLAYLHSYVWLEAARSFNRALALDPRLAVANAMLSTVYTELNAPAAARDALERARVAAPKASAHDRLHIELRVLQAAAEQSPGDGARLAAYRSALDAALTKYPKDDELWLARGQAESSVASERGQGSGAGSVRFYESAVATVPGHFAAHHYLTHALENSGRVDQALVEGTTYARMAPNVPHAHHMLGHNLRRAGRVETAIAEFKAADALETEYFKSEKIPVEYDWHYQHNVDLLATSYQYLGQMRQAEVLLRTSFAIRSTSVEQELNKREWPTFLLARGRVAEALDAAATMVAHPSPVVGAAGHVMAGEARLALRQYQAATEEANTALRLMRNVEGAGMVAPALQQLQGEFFLRTDQREKGRAALQDVARKIRSAPGPDAWTQALFALEAIARAARDADDWEFAGWAARQIIEHDPNYAGGHYAQALVAEHAGDQATSRAGFARMRALWSKADPTLPEMQRLQ